MNFSIIISIFNRKKELEELLYSLTNQSYKNFEVLVIDDGSYENLFLVVKKFFLILDIKYYKKNNSGPALSRNFGSKLAKNEYLIFLDSDCIVPKKYLENVSNELVKNYVDAFSGPDFIHKNFTLIQKAISYSMTSIFTTGGIRRNLIFFSKKKIQLRSFNMGINNKVFISVGGFSNLRIGEDSDLSMKLWEKYYSIQYFYKCSVYHKRRHTLDKFAKQLYQFGIARIILNKRYPKYNKIIFCIPSIFLIGWMNIIFLFLVNYIFSKCYEYINILLYTNMFCYYLYFIVILFHSSQVNRSIKIGILSVITSMIQLNSYGLGYLYAFIIIFIFKRDPKKNFSSHFYIQ